VVFVIRTMDSGNNNKKDLLPYNAIYNNYMIYQQ